MTHDVIDPWLARFVATALARDLEGHMAMISPQVLVFGVPGFDTLDFQDWYRQCEHEFPQGLIRELTYDRVKLRSADQERLAEAATDPD